MFTIRYRLGVVISTSTEAVNSSLCSTGTYYSIKYFRLSSNTLPVLELNETLWNPHACQNSEAIGICLCLIFDIVLNTFLVN